MLRCASMITAFAISAGTAHAGPDRISILLGSEHINATRSFEEFNPGIFLHWTESLFRNRVDLSFGAFRNSYGDGSLAVSTAYPIVRNETWSLDVFTALAWYPGNGDQFGHAIGDIVPIAGLQGRYKNIFVQAIPAGGESVDATLTFGLTFGLK